MKNSRTWSRAIVVGLAVVLLHGCGRGEGHAEIEFLEGITIANHERVRVFYEKSGIGVFVGPTTTGRDVGVSGNGISVSEGTFFEFEEVWEPLATGHGTDKHGNDCNVWIMRARPGGQPFPSWRLSDKQATKVQSGEWEVIEVRALCHSDT